MDLRSAVEKTKNPGLPGHVGGRSKAGSVASDGLPAPALVVACLFMVLGLNACLTDEGQGPIEPASLSAVAVSDNQQAPAGGNLPNPLQVTVLTEDGQPSLRASVRWEVVSGPAGASLSDSVTLADGTGVAQAVLRVGSVGTYTIRAALVVDATKAVTLTAEAIAAPELTSVTPSTFAASDVVLLSGQNLTVATRFEFGGTVVRVIDGSLNPTSVSVVVPPCLPGGAVAIRALFAGASSAAISGSYTASSAPIILDPGEYVSVSPGDVAGCASIPPASVAGAQYLIAAQSVSGEPEVSVDYRLGTGDVIPTDLPQTAPVDFAKRFHDFIRRLEHELPNARLPESRLEGAVMATPVSVGDRRDFVVCDKIGCTVNADFAPVRAEAMYVGDRAAIYQDLDAPSGGFTNTDFTQLGQQFDDVLYDVDTRAFGAESDVDDNNLVIILMSPVVNGLTSPDVCEDSFVSGFFFSIDINPVFSGDPRSNQGEVFYALVPDNQGVFSCTHATEQVRRAVPVTFVHEFQHMISYHQHVLLRGGSSEQGWLNEALSHLAEELAAFRFLSSGDSTSFSRFAIGNLVNAYDYLANTGDLAVAWTGGSGTLAQRGAGWLFLRWLIDRYGEPITRRLLETNLVGADNVESAIGEPIERLFSEWFLTNWVSDLPGFESTERLRYNTWNLRTTFASLNQQSPQVFPTPYPLEPFAFSTVGDFSHTGALRAGSGNYYILNQEAAAPGRALEFTAPSGQPLGDEASPVLNIIRIR
jgi:hypothetical protein